MKVKVFIDGSSGTTGLRIADRLAARPEIELLSISAEGRKDVHERAKVINSADLAFLCLPDAASKEVMPLLRPDVKVHGLNEPPPENGLYSTAMAGTDRMELYLTVNAAGDQMMLVSLFDNLGKGSSGAAVQCMNLMLGLEETKGLE